MLSHKAINIILSIVVIVGTLSAVAVINRKNEQNKAKYEALKDVLVPSDVNADQGLLEHLDFEGLSVNYEPKWVVNTYIIEDNFYGTIHTAAFNTNTSNYHTSYIVNWYPCPSKQIDKMLERLRDEMLQQYKSTDIKTTTTNIAPCEWNGIAGKSFDLTAVLGSYIINRRAIIFRSGQYEFRIEMATDISRESLDTYFTQLEENIHIDDII